MSFSEKKKGNATYDDNFIKVFEQHDMGSY